MAQQLSFARDIRPLFRDRDIQSMQSAFDLASYEDVRTHGEPIYAVLAAGQMPCDGRVGRRGRAAVPIVARHGRTPLARDQLIGRAEAAMDVVVDHADVLHERVHARRPDEAVPLRLQLLRERLRLRGRLG